MEKREVKKRNSIDGEGVERTEDGEFMVRGRKFQTNKPITFNQPWTKEEQKRLEELLETMQFEKIKPMTNRQALSKISHISNL